MGFFMYMTALGPEVGPTISGFASLKSWQWTFWAALIIAGAGLPVICVLPETYAPVLRRRQRLHVESSHSTKLGIMQLFARPFVMIVQELILLFTSLYLALVYAILYLFFQAYPVIF